MVEVQPGIFRTVRLDVPVPNIHLPASAGDWRQYFQTAALWAMLGFLLGGGKLDFHNPFKPSPTPSPVVPVPTPTPTPTPTPPAPPKPDWIVPDPPAPPRPTPLNDQVGRSEWRALEWAPGWEGYGREVNGKFMMERWRRIGEQ
jgi:hypothetical protein